MWFFDVFWRYVGPWIQHFFSMLHVIIFDVGRSSLGTSVDLHLSSPQDRTAEAKMLLGPQCATTTSKEQPVWVQIAKAKAPKISGFIELTKFLWAQSSSFAPGWGASSRPASDCQVFFFIQLAQKLLSMLPCWVSISSEFGIAPSDKSQGLSRLN